jgi:YbbR domain-containing protein
MTAPLPPGPSSRARWRHALREAFAERLGIKTLAIIIAILLWLIVKGRQPVQEYVSVRVMPTLDSSLVLLEQPATLTALVSGRAVDIAKLRADPPAVHRIVNEDAPDTLVLQVAASDVRVSPELANDVHVLDVQPRFVSLRFGDKATKRVRVNAGPDRVTIFGNPPHDVFVFHSDPSSVRISGPRQLVRRIKEIRPHSLMITSADSEYVADLDTVGLGVRVVPTRVKISLRCAGTMEGGSGRPCKQ